MSLNFTVVDAFTDKPFSGNPACVILVPEDHTYSYDQLLGIAREFNLSETAYVAVPTNGARIVDGYSTFHLRWFTTEQEFKLCGHATLASASIVFNNEQLVPSNVHEIRFTTLSGILTARRVVSDSGPLMYEIELPASGLSDAPEPILEKVKGVVFRATIPPIEVKYVGLAERDPYESYLLVEVDSKVPLKDLKHHSSILAELFPPHGIVIFCQETRLEDGDKGWDYRTFASPLGLIEDPVCGSATSFAAMHWTRRSDGIKRVNKIRSASARGGNLEVVWEEGQEIVKIRGRARIASRGEIFL